MMILQVILEGIGLGVLLILVCAIGIRKGAVDMMHLYSQEVQERCVTLGVSLLFVCSNISAQGVPYVIVSKAVF